MATVYKTITLTDEQNDWIKAQLDAGHYANESEYIRQLIRAKLNRIRAALIDGETSGEPRSFNASAFKQRMLNAHG